MTGVQCIEDKVMGVGKASIKSISDHKWQALLVAGAVVILGVGVLG